MSPTDFILWPVLAALLFFTRKQALMKPLLALTLLLLYNRFCSPGFFDLEIKEGHLYGRLIDILNQGAKVMLLALGMSLVIATGGVDLSVGAIMAVAGAVLAQGVAARGWSPATAITAALGVSALLGLWNGLLVAFLRIQPIVATLILMVAGRGLAMLITDGQIINFENPSLVFLGNGYFLGLPFTLTLVLVMLGLTAFLTRRTALGLFLEATGDNETACRYAGLPARNVKFLTYVFAAFCAGLAGLIATSNIKSADANNIGLYLELDAILAVVVGGAALTGGRFHLLAAMVGALFIQTLTTTLYAANVSADIAPVPKALVIIAVCLLQSPVLRPKLAKLLAKKERPA